VKIKHAAYPSVLFSPNHASYSMIYRVAENKIPQQTICNFSAISCPIVKILEAA